MYMQDHINSFAWMQRENRAIIINLFMNQFLERFCR